jgi:branched-chain amino acid transport system substrate-binding protein
MTTRRSPSRRTVLKGVGALAALALAPATLRAQGEPLRLGILTPLTGAGSADGPRMLAAMQAVAKEVGGRRPRPPERNHHRG